MPTVKRKTESSHTKYPVLDWFEQCEYLEDNQVLVIVQGTDYDITSRSMAEYLWRHAREQEVEISISQTEDSIEMRLK